jgi:RsiW-degrading membrane proteinase PrsW (M82 family)
VFLIAVIALGATVALYRYNRDELDERPRWRVLVPYVVGAVLILLAAGVTAVVVDQPTQGPAPRIGG